MVFILEGKRTEGEATPVPRNEAKDCAPRDLAFNSSKIEESFIIGFSLIIFSF